MKLHIDTENKTVAMEGEVQVSTVFNYLMSWFPEDWEKWKFIPFVPTIQYKEVVVYKDVYKNPYWDPWKTTMIYTGGSIANPSFTDSTKTSFNFNNL